jgi:hypothetical protein
VVDVVPFLDSDDTENTSTGEFSGHIVGQKDSYKTCSFIISQTSYFSMISNDCVDQQVKSRPTNVRMQPCVTKQFSGLLAGLGYKTLCK